MAGRPGAANGDRVEQTCEGNCNLQLVCLREGRKRQTKRSRGAVSSSLRLSSCVRCRAAAYDVVQTTTTYLSASSRVCPLNPCPGPEEKEVQEHGTHRNSWFRFLSTIFGKASCVLRAESHHVGQILPSLSAARRNATNARVAMSAPAVADGQWN